MIMPPAYPVHLDSETRIRAIYETIFPSIYSSSFEPVEKLDRLDRYRTIAYFLADALESEQRKKALIPLEEKFEMYFNLSKEI
jgi:hypothetical protein